MQHKTIRVLFVLILSLALLDSPSRAQTDAPVQIDMSVLNAADPGLGQDTQVQTKNSLQGWRPQLTNSHERAPIRNAAQPSAAKSVPTTESSKIVRFPLQVKDRDNTYDPSSNKTPVYTGQVQPEVIEVKQPPIPAFKPIKSVAFKDRVQKKAPVPKKRPEAPATEKILAEPATSRKTEIVMATDLSKGGIEMPAVPAATVDEEALAPPKTAAEMLNDKFARQLRTPSKMEMVKSIEKVAALAEALSPVDAGTSVVKSMPRPISVNKTNVPLPLKKPNRNINVAAAKLAKIEPAAGKQTIERTQPQSFLQKPRTPPEQDFEKEYISMAYEQGMTDMDQQTLSRINDEILGLLKQNPEWRLQIQSFAEKTDDQLSNARRISLSRALAIRTHLLSNGIEARRMDVRALGMQTDRTPIDRVDFVFFNPEQTN